MNKNTKDPTIKTSDIRQSFLDYFQSHDHKLVPSSPVIPFDDPTILFINAGMNQFKDVFTGKRKIDHKRATSSQKCIRAGGKHNDLDNVGFTARHHTFFEMLGNFSFGDYFKEEAIEFAWKYLTGHLKLPVDKLYATVYETDDEAFELWAKIAPELANGRIVRFGKKDNYWSMGPVGPCGPCSEIHIDRGEKYGTGPDDILNGEGDRFIEIWNLVFMQYDQLPDGKVVDLPKPSVDTGAGLERFAAVLQDVPTNYGIDLFRPLLENISEISGCKYKDHVASHHVIADHIRALTFAIADGAGISNEGQGYVLRRILRRAARHGRLLGIEEPFIYKLVPTLVNEMGDAFPEIREKQTHVETVIKAEEESFGRTLATGLELFDGVAKKVKATGQTVVNGTDVFKLYDTFGFPFDLTEIIAGEQGLTLDKTGFEKAMNRQKEQSRACGKFVTFTTGFSIETTKKVTATLQMPIEWNSDAGERFVRDQMELTTRIVYPDSDQNIIVLESTPFYFESGGQVGDIGFIESEKFSIKVLDVKLDNGKYVHICSDDSCDIASLKPGQKVTAKVDASHRKSIMRNHTATHLLHAALREVLGDHIKQSGSYVGPDRLRFDFSHHQPMTPEEIVKVEKIANNQVLENNLVDTQIMDVNEAKKSGATALFGEKYGDKVRVVSIGKFSKELCGGTHVNNVSEIGPVIITMETGIASGVRRLEAVTGHEAIRRMLDYKTFRRQVAEVVGRTEDDALAGVQHLKETASSLQKEIKKVKAEMFAGAGTQIGQSTTKGIFTVNYNDFGDTDRDTMSGWADQQKNATTPTIALAIGMVKGKCTTLLAASSPAVKEHKVHMGNLAKELFTVFGGRGGGKPNFAQGGVETGSSVNDMAKKLIELLPD